MTEEFTVDSKCVMGVFSLIYPVGGRSISMTNLGLSVLTVDRSVTDIETNRTECCYIQWSNYEGTRGGLAP